MYAVRVALRRFPAVECGAADAAHQRAPDLAVELLAPRPLGRNLGPPVPVLAPFGEGGVWDGEPQLGPRGLESLARLRRWRLCHWARRSRCFGDVDCSGKRTVWLFSRHQIASLTAHGGCTVDQSSAADGRAADFLNSTTLCRSSSAERSGSRVLRVGGVFSAAT